MGLLGMIFYRGQVQNLGEIPDAEGAEVAQKTQKRPRKTGNENMGIKIDKERVF
jgi:hypothetical protein